jgi:hypothetical protein
MKSSTIIHPLLIFFPRPTLPINFDPFHAILPFEGQALGFLLMLLIVMRKFKRYSHFCKD